eukprot:scaffold5100_cov73-Isochrysis_galbana.AAC.1
MPRDYAPSPFADAWVDTSRPRPEDGPGLIYAPGGLARSPDKPKFEAFSGGGQALGGSGGGGDGSGGGGEAEQLARALAMSWVRTR